MARPHRRLVAGYRDRCRLGSAAEFGTPEFRAWAAICQLVSDDPETAWTVLLAVIEDLRVEEDLALSMLGADALEDLVREHGAAFIDRVEDAARTSDKFRVALASVWAFDSPVRPRIDAILSELGQPLL